MMDRHVCRPTATRYSVDAMPYSWDTPDRRRLTLWPHRSLTPGGFAAFFGITFLLLMVPVLLNLGSPVLWMLLPFVLGALALTWALVRRNGRDRGAILEVLTVTSDAAELVRTDPGGGRRNWKANPYWVRVQLWPTGGPVENYLTLKGGDREVEIGAFLSPDERIALKPELEDALRRA
jgi:uncharacterized membrane protein